MPNPLPVLRMQGLVRTVTERHVPAAEAREAEYDESGGLVRAAREYREGYDVWDVVVLTDAGGFATVLFRDLAVAEAGGFLPTVGDRLDVPVRCFASWQQTGTRKWVTVGYSFAGAEYASEAESRTGTGRRSAEPVAS
jgi:hypothetical protein